MKKLVLLLLVILNIGVASAQETNTVHLSFSKDQYSFSYDLLNVLSINVKDENLSTAYGIDTSDPCIPFVAVNVKMPETAVFKNFTVSSSNELVFDDVLLATNPVCVPTNVEALANTPAKVPHYAKSHYPSAQVEYVMSTKMDGHSIFHFRVCPWSYDANNKKLYLNNNIFIKINASNEDDVTTQNEEFVNFCSANNIDFGPVSYSSNMNTDSIDYIIITSEELAYYFQTFAAWKNQKGVRTIIETIEDIQNMDKGSGRSLQDKIKAYLLYTYHMKGMKFKYLLLAGDEKIIPSKKCYGKCGSEIENIPADIFYACLDYKNDPFWDKSQNGVYGELNDSISFSQDIFVTRLPVNTSTEVKNAVMNILCYEQNPTENGWNNTMLMSGAKLGMIDNGHSDAEILGDATYKNIQSYWNGQRYKFFDTYSDFENESIKIVNKNNFQKVLSKGFAFIDVISHGDDDAWGLSNGSYTCKDAELLNSNQYSIVTTTACNTNAFDRNDTCFSEALMRNVFSRVIGYFGCSRFGWFYKGDLMYYSPSSVYERAFYRELFGSELREKNFGKIVAYAKNSMTGHCTYYNSERWLMFGLNPLGDAEMPIYTTTPKEFSGIQMTRKLDNAFLNIGVDGCTVCVMSVEDNGASYYKVYKNVNSVNIGKVNTALSVCITKQNYIPAVYNLKPTTIDLSGNILQGVLDGNGLTISTKLGSNVTSAYLTVLSATGNSERSYSLSSDKTSVTENSSVFANGVHIISLYVNGKKTDSMQIMKR